MDQAAKHLEPTTSKPASVPAKAMDGNVLLRAGIGRDSIAIMELSGGDFSHAGICGDENDQTAIDAFPRGETVNAVAKQSLTTFFFPIDKENFTKRRAILEYVGNSAANDGANSKKVRIKSQRAAHWARLQIDKATAHFSEGYVFDISDPIVGTDLKIAFNNRLYCSEFVWHCYYEGANVNLLPESDFAELLSEDNLKSKRDMFIDLIRDHRGSYTRFVPGKVLLKGARRQFTKTRHPGRWLAPSQLAHSKYLRSTWDDSGCRLDCDNSSLNQTHGSKT